METRTITTRRGRTVESPYSDEVAVTRLRALIQEGALDSQFARDLAYNRNLTEEQAAWVHVLVCEHERPPARPTVGTTLSPLIRFFDTAAQKLRTPRVTFQLPALKIEVSRAGSKSKYPGALNVTDGGAYGANVWYGRVELDGSFTPSRAMRDEVAEVLQAFAADPAGYAGEYGRKSGRCCFCGTGLTNDGSLAVGYGPICAKKFGLPWTPKAAREARVA
jgi:hypothetical protein